MKEFDIKTAQAGDSGLCRDGKHEWKILCFLQNDPFPIVVKVSGPQINDVIKYNILGKNQWSIGEEFDHDLMQHDVSEQKYIVILQHNETGSLYVHHEIFESIEKASKADKSRAYTGWAKLIKIQPVIGV